MACSSQNMLPILPCIVSSVWLLGKRNISEISSSTVSILLIWNIILTALYIQPNFRMIWSTWFFQFRLLLICKLKTFVSCILHVISQSANLPSASQEGLCSMESDVCSYIVRLWVYPFESVHSIYQQKINSAMST